MTDLTPKTPYRPLRWTDAVVDIQELLTEWNDPIYIVGGAVRDALLGRPIKDLDLATPGDSTAIARKIANNMPNGSLYIMDAERGVARANIETMDGPMQVDVAQFRGGTDDFYADLIDRDFTINAMAVDLLGDLSLMIDPLNGMQDIADKTVRRCRQGSIASDPIRALRAVRQSTALKYRIEPATLAEVRAAAGTLMASTSAERVRDEFYQTLSLNRPVAALRVLDVLGFLDDVLELNTVSDRARRDDLLSGVDKMANLLRGMIPSRRTDSNLATDFAYGMALMQLALVRPNLETHLMENWAAGRLHWAHMVLLMLVQDYSTSVGDLAERLRLSNPEKKRLLACVQHKDAVFNMTETSDLAMHRFWYELRGAGVDVCLYTLADYLAEKGPALEQEAWLAVVERVKTLLEAYYLRYEEIVAPPPVIDGQGLMKSLDIKPGKVVGELLNLVREAQVTGEVRSAADALSLARTHLDNKS
jgi:tRNA nucleotidyltransferase/poly(A) polymerase